MSKRVIKKRVYDDSIVLMDNYDEPDSPRTKRIIKPKRYYDESDDSFQYGQTKKKDLKTAKKVHKQAEKAAPPAPPPAVISPRKQQYPHHAKPISKIPVPPAPVVAQPAPSSEVIRSEQPPKQQVRYVEAQNTQYVVRYLDTRKKLDRELKVFNPDEYNKHLEMKKQAEKRLADLYDQYGKMILKMPEPKTKVTGWEHLLKHIEEAGKERMEERQHRVRLAKKVARYAQMTYNKIQLMHEQKEKEEERKIRRTASSVWKLVQKDYWRNVVRVEKYLQVEERKRCEKEQQSKKLEQLVEKQLEVSSKISAMMEGIDQIELANLTVSINMVPPIIINIKRNPGWEYNGLQQDKTIRQPLLIKHPLREYQLLGMHWIYTLHNRRMNGILADEMGLGKTIQTISFLAHLALQKGVWGPHLVIVPTSIIVNWEIEFKRWCPAFKIMTYYGSPKERKLKRKGWSKLNTFHVCITSYKIVVTDQAIFKRKKWYYMVLDEAQNIKNYKSQRWQTLLNFNSKYRLLLTGTPLQNDISELWSLLHFLMPALFTSYKDFNEWFNIPFQEALQKNHPISHQILRKLHTILRPFFLRRLKKDVEKQLPHKTEAIIRCPLSRRQKYLYDEFISHENKKNPEIMGMMNILMQLKKVCNHPDLFLPRTEQSPLNWPYISVVVATHVMIKCREIPDLFTEVEGVKIRYEDAADLLINQFQNLKMTKYTFKYYMEKYRTRLTWLRSNYDRSLRRAFNPMPPSVVNRCTFDFNNQWTRGITLEERIRQFEPVFENFLMAVPKVITVSHRLNTSKFSTTLYQEQAQLEQLTPDMKKMLQVFHPIQSRLTLHFPEKNILLYDCGKLIKMAELLKTIKQRGEKALIFTQMTKMLDVFEKIMNMHKFNYVRLDGGTKTEVRQQLVERFNNDPRVLCFISSTRSGGIGLNLTGASNVIFYDTDWNPAMDKQAQDRCHRIGQTRNVTIYRLITEHTIEENILMKSIQKRKLDEMITEDGMFNTQYFEKVNIRDMLEGVIGGGEAIEADLADVEDQEDRQMLLQAEREGKDFNDFGKEQEIDTQMFPLLFTYGLAVLRTQGLGEDQPSSDSEIEDKDEDEEQQVDITGEEGVEISPIKPEQEGSRSVARLKETMVEQVEEENKMPIEEQIIQDKSLRVTEFERFSGIATYQKHLNHIRKNFFETATE